MSDSTYEDDLDSRRNFSSILNRAERIYLAVLRALALIFATLLLLYAAWLGASGLYKVSKDAESVKEATAAVTAEDLTAIDLKSAEAAPQGKSPDPAKQQRAYYEDFNKRYLALYRSKFEPFLQQNDARASEKDFESRFLQIGDRLEAIKEGNLIFDADKADLEALLKVMTEAAAAKVSQDRLRTYKTARKTSVSRTVTDMRTERYCSEYGYFIDMCIDWSTRQVPVRRTVTEVKLPEGVVSPRDLFSAYHDKYVTTLGDRRRENAVAAEKARADILEDNAAGAQSLWTATQIVGLFIVLMFLFLLIALERHQRKIAQAQAVRD